MRTFFSALLPQASKRLETLRTSPLFSIRAHDPGFMIRRGALVAVPVALCLAIEFGFDAPTKGAIASGAFICGFAGFDAPAAQRLRWQAVTALLIGLSATLGALASQTTLVAVASILVVGLLGGYCVSISPWMGTVGLLATLSFLVAQGLHIPIREAPEVLLWAGLGALTQSVWSGVVWLKDRTAADKENGWNRTRAWEGVKANLTFSSEPMRHAIRLGGSLAVGVGLYCTLGITDHGFWIPLTIVFAMKTDRDETFARLLMRGVGTLAGLVVATALVELFGGSELVVWALVVLFGALSYGLLSIHYALFTAAITIYIILLTVHSGEAPLQADGQRAFGTLVGLIIALVSFVLLPNPAMRKNSHTRAPAEVGEALKTY